MLSRKTPVPKEIPSNYAEFIYPNENRVYLPLPEDLGSQTFEDVLSRRRSRREFLPVPEHKLSALLWFAFKVHEHRADDKWQHRPCPSAGGRHPIDILVISSTAQLVGDKDVFVYEPIAHVLIRQNVPMHKVSKLIDETDHVLSIQSATILWFVAQPGRTLSKYENGESLIWRDAGAMIATTCLVAEALRLNCCAIGTTGEPMISDMFEAGQTLFGVGGCLIGESQGEGNKKTPKSK